MSKKPKSWKECREKGDFIKTALDKGAEVTEATNHTKIKGPRGATFLKRHGELSPQARHDFIKQLIAIGLGVLILVCSYSIFF